MKMVGAANVIKKKKRKELTRVHPHPRHCLIRIRINLLQYKKLYIVIVESRSFHAH